MERELKACAGSGGDAGMLTSRLHDGGGAIIERGPGERERSGGLGCTLHIFCRILLTGPFLPLQELTLIWLVNGIR